MSVITLRIECTTRKREGDLRLPDALYKIHRTLEALDTYAHDPHRAFKLRGVQCEVAGIERYIRMTDVNSESDLRKLDRLARELDGMDDRCRKALAGALDAERVDSLDGVLDIADRLAGCATDPEQIFY